MDITQRIEKLDFTTYYVTLELPNGELITRTYEHGNEVFPAYKTLIEALRKYDGVGIHIETNCKALADEYNSIRENPNSMLLGNLKEVIARRGLSVMIEYKA